MVERRSQRPVWLGDDGRGWDHVRVHLQLLTDSRLAADAIAVYAVLAMHAELRTGDARPAQATIGLYTGRSWSSVHTALTLLEVTGYIEIIARPGRSSVYRLLPPPSIPEEVTVGGRKPDRRRQALLTALAERDGWTCRYCGLRLVPPGEEDELCTQRAEAWLLPAGFAWPTIDHILARSQGGSDELTNLVLACMSCNARKGNRVEVIPTPVPQPGVSTLGLRDEIPEPPRSDAETSALGADEQVVNERKRASPGSAAPPGQPADAMTRTQQAQRAIMEENMARMAAEEPPLPPEDRKRLAAEVREATRQKLGR